MDFAGKRTIDMLGYHRFSRRLGAGLAALAVTFAPLAAPAQDDLPSYARPAVVSTDETIHGRIRSVDGAFDISVDDDRGFIDSVQLHQGTIINPTGLTLSPGMSVTILGVNVGAMFEANEIDTPYSYAGPLPTPVYYGSGYWCPGFSYGYGPSFSLAIIIVGGGRPWYYEHRPFRGRPWNGHHYFGAAIARDPEPRVRLEQRRHVDSPSMRSERVAGPHRPAAFAGRTFAGESRTVPERFGTQSTTNVSAAPRFHDDIRGPVPGARYERGSMPARGVYERSAEAPRGVAERSTGVARSGYERGTESARGSSARAEGAHGGARTR
jgi:hypothetical protein